jgi:hypothetical protein
LSIAYISVFTEESTMTNNYLLARLAGRDLNLRAGDADRERVAERLRQSAAEGRLDVNELQERLESCYQARTFGQLSELVADLPRPVTEPERSRFDWLGDWRWAVRALAPLLLVLLVVSAASGHHHVFWLFWIPLVFLFWRMSSWRRRRWPAATRRGPNDWV